jgi:hypothetical protein
MISESALRGYVLEEVLARLLRENGYNLLVRASQDRAAFRDSARGLLVRGRAPIIRRTRWENCRSLRRSRCLSGSSPRRSSAARQSISPLSGT